MHQLADFVRARKLFAYGEMRDYFDHQNCVGYVVRVVLYTAADVKRLIDGLGSGTSGMMDVPL